MNLNIYKNDIIPVYITELGNKVVKARELYEFLEVKDPFAQWVKRRIKEHQLIDNKDFCCLSLISETQTKSGRKGSAIKSEYILRLHSAKKIALGTNNKKGDQIKDYFIKCEEVVSAISQKIFTLPDYANKNNQKELCKHVSGIIYNNGETSDIILHHQNNYIIHFGTTPSKFRKDLVSKGYRVKSKSGRDLARQFKPEAACSMAIHDEFVSKGQTLSSLNEINLRGKLEPAFKALIELGFIPAELSTEKNLLKK